MILGILIICIVIIGPGLMLLFLHQHIQRYSKSSGSKWMLLTVMAWGFLWVIHRLIVRVWGDLMSPELRLLLLIVSIILCLLIYGLIYWYIGHQGRMNHLNNQVKKIGHSPEQDH
ncbi:MAG: hypothetical protein AAF587_36540 [Bacteroidota bacterium]